MRIGLAHRYGHCLPTLEEASQLFLVSIDTVRATICEPETEGYISLSEAWGLLSGYYTHLRNGTAHTGILCPQNGLIDVNAPYGPVQPCTIGALAFKTHSPETLDKIQALSSDSPPSSFHITVVRIPYQHIYGSLDNDHADA